MARRPASRGAASRRASSWIVPAPAIALVAAAAVLVVSGCGGGATTTVIEKVTTGTTTATPGDEKPALLKLPAYEHETVEPTIYSFVVDGSFAGTHLQWEGWGSSTATGTGIIEERDFNGDWNDRRHYPGTVIATGLETCKGRDYYTEVSANVPPNAIYVPEETTQLTTPCRSWKSIQDEAEPDEAVEEEPETPKAEAFYTPSRNIGCALSPEGIRCDIRHKTWTPPPKPSDCMLDWGHSVGLETGQGEVLCTGDTLLTGDYRVLAYGEQLRRGIFGCASHENGLTCTDNYGHGFFLSVSELRLF